MYVFRTRLPVSIIRKLYTPRLACVKPAASVHPEPGSNSSLYIYRLLNFFTSTHLSRISVIKLLYYFATLVSMISMNYFPLCLISLLIPSPQIPYQSFGSAKILPFSILPNLFALFFSLVFSTPLSILIYKKQFFQKILS